MTKSKKAIETVLTDPAKEFADLIQKLNNYNPSTQDSTYTVIASFVGIDHGSSQLYEIMGIVASRAIELEDFITHLNDEYLDEDLRSTLVSGVSSFAQILNPSTFNTRWDHVRAGAINDQMIRLLRSFSQTARRHKPLRQIEEGDKENILQQIDEAIEELDHNTDIPPWAVSSIRDSLRRLKLMVTYLEFFGHEAIIDHVVKMNGEAEAFSEVLKKAGYTVAGNLWKTAKVMATVIGVLVAPLKAEEVYVGYKGYAHQLISKPPALIAGPLKQIAGPNKNNPPESTPSEKNKEKNN